MTTGFRRWRLRKSYCPVVKGYCIRPESKSDVTWVDHISQRTLDKLTFRGMVSTVLVQVWLWLNLIDRNTCIARLTASPCRKHVAFLTEKRCSTTTNGNKFPSLAFERNIQNLIKWKNQNVKTGYVLQTSRGIIISLFPQMEIDPHLLCGKRHLRRLSIILHHFKDTDNSIKKQVKQVCLNFNGTFEDEARGRELWILMIDSAKKYFEKSLATKVSGKKFQENNQRSQ